MSTIDPETAAHDFDNNPEGMLPLDFSDQITDQLPTGEKPVRAFGDTPLQEAVDKKIVTRVADSPAVLPEAHAALPAAEAPVTDSPLPQTSDRKRNKWLIPGVAAGTTALLAVVGVGLAVKANKGSDESPDRSTKPVAASTRTPGATSTPSTSPSSTATQSPTTLPSATVSATTPNTAPSTVGVEASMSVADFSELIDKSTVDSLIAEYPQLEQAINPDYMKAVAARKGVTAEKIAAYRTALQEAYANPDTARALGDPLGAMSPSLNASLQQQFVINEIAQTAAGFRKGIAEGLFHKTPGISPDLANLVSLDDGYVKKFKHEITTRKFPKDPNNTEMIKDTDPNVTHVDELAAVSYTDVNGAEVTLLGALTTYSDGEILHEMYAVAPIGSIESNDTLGSDFLVTVPFNDKKY
jgi:hypothetical protein